MRDSLELDGLDVPVLLTALKNYEGLVSNEIVTGQPDTGFVSYQALLFTTEGLIEKLEQILEG